MKPPIAGQLALFGVQFVHLASGRHCLMCKSDLEFAAVWDDCSSCRGWVEPVPWWMELGAEPAVQLELREAA